MRAQGLPILGCEPSCLLTLVDEYRDFRLGPDADEVAAAVARWSTPSSPTAIASPSCRLKPLAGPRPAPRPLPAEGRCRARRGRVAALRRIPGLEVKELDSGCCGMAGSFGYELGHYDVSKALANRVLLPAAAADPDGPAGRPRLLLPQPGPRPGGDRRGASDRAPGRAARRDAVMLPIVLGAGPTEGPKEAGGSAPDRGLPGIRRKP